MSDECSSQVEQGEGDQQSDSSVCSCGDKRHDAEQNSDDLKKQSSDQHNENERKRSVNWMGGRDMNYCYY